ncbi:MAG: hypothetical protein CL608_09420 [Anaerolineaceae bacterium]|nr:hypothetical protein [Anaerolineaceae bacterium]
MTQQMVNDKESGGDGRYWWRKKGEAKCSRPQPKPGDNCPNCHNGKLVFDGLFILTCDCCQHVADSGGFT